MALHTQICSVLQYGALFCCVLQRGHISHISHTHAPTRLCARLHSLFLIESLRSPHRPPRAIHFLSSLQRVFLHQCIFTRVILFEQEHKLVTPLKLVNSSLKNTNWYSPRTQTGIQTGIIITNTLLEHKLVYSSQTRQTPKLLPPP